MVRRKEKSLSRFGRLVCCNDLISRPMIGVRCRSPARTHGLVNLLPSIATGGKMLLVLSSLGKLPDRQRFASVFPEPPGLVLDAVVGLLPHWAFADWSWMITLSNAFSVPALRAFPSRVGSCVNVNV